MIDAISKRQDYPCLKTHSYLNQASLGLTGEVAVSAMHNFLDETARHGNLRMSDVDEANFCVLFVHEWLVWLELKKKM